MAEGTSVATEWKETEARHQSRSIVAPFELNPPSDAQALENWITSLTRAFSISSNRVLVETLTEKDAWREWNGAQAHAVGVVLGKLMGRAADLSGRILYILSSRPGSESTATTLFLNGMVKSWSAAPPAIVDASVKERGRIETIIAGLVGGEPVDALTIKMLQLYATHGFASAFRRLDDLVFSMREAAPELRDLVTKALQQSGASLIARPDVDIQTRADVTIALFDTLAKVGRADLANRALAKLRDTALPNELYLAVLSATKPWKALQREPFLARAEHVLKDRLGAERADHLLRFVK
jgi:hypothetical protein